MPENYQPKNIKYKFKIPLFKRPFGSSYEVYYLTGFAWDCNWYWGGGYIDNNNRHTHFNSIFFDRCNDSHFFSEEYKDCELLIPEKEMYILLDLYRAFYTLRELAEIYKHDKYTICTENFLKRIGIKIKDDESSFKINSEIEAKVIPAIVKLVEILPEKVKKMNERKDKISELEAKLHIEKERCGKAIKELEDQIFKLKKGGN